MKFSIDLFTPEPHKHELRIIGETSAVVLLISDDEYKRVQTLMEKERVDKK